MQFKPLTFLVLLAVGGSVQAGTFYDPTNDASKDGKTIGYELYRTIGCPGRGLLDAPCPGDTAAAKPAPAPTPEVVPAPAAEVTPAPAPEITPGPAPVVAAAPVDSDGDGVSDDKDRCPDTPAGAQVNADGCELDGDGDGVVDRLDQCPATPVGHKVNAQGCEMDSDGDGVLDDVDQCPTTPAGDQVDDKGCSLAKALSLHEVNFDNNDATLRPDAITVLDEAVASLKANPAAKVEIAGHTDSRNSEWYNQGLGERRANVVRQYLISHGVAADRLVAKSYGESQPVADNETEEGRVKNRRVELKVID